MDDAANPSNGPDTGRQYAMSNSFDPFYRMPTRVNLTVAIMDGEDTVEY